MHVLVCSVYEAAVAIDVIHSAEGGRFKFRAVVGAFYRHAVWCAAVR